MALIVNAPPPAGPNGPYEFGFFSRLVAINFGSKSRIVMGTNPANYVPAQGSYNPRTGLTYVYSDAGAKLFSRDYPDEEVRVVALDRNDAYVVGRVYIKPGATLNKITVAKYSKSNVKTWEKELYAGGSASPAFISAAACDFDGNALIVWSPPAGGTSFLTKMNSATGATVWTKNLGSSSLMPVLPSALAADGDGNIVLSTSTQYFKYNSSGTLLWAKAGTSASLSPPGQNDFNSPKSVFDKEDNVFTILNGGLKKFDNLGNTIASRVSPLPRAVDFYPDNSLYSVEFNKSAPVNPPTIIAYDKNFGVKWTRVLPVQRVFNVFIGALSSGVVVKLDYRADPLFSSDTYLGLWKYSASGTLQWSKPIIDGLRDNVSPGGQFIFSGLQAPSAFTMGIARTPKFKDPAA